MSKKDKKRIAELERQQSILSATVRVMRVQFNTFFDGKISPLSGGLLQPETAKDSPAQDGAKLDLEQVDFVRLGRNFGKSGAGIFKPIFEGQDKAEQEKPAQSEPAMTEKEQELLAQLNAELAKFTSLEAFNADRKNRSLPPVNKLEFDKAKSYFDYTLAAAKMLRPQWYDKINQIKMPVSEQSEVEPKQGSDGADSPTRTKTDQHEIHQPNPQKVALNKMVLGRIEEIKKLLANPNFGVGELYFFIDDCIEELNLDLADFRRKFLDFGRVKPSNVEQKEVEQGEEKQTETEKGQVWIVKTNPKSDKRVIIFYVEYIEESGLIAHTPDKDKAMHFISYDAAAIEMNNAIRISDGRYRAADFEIVQMDAKQSK